jgi:hypothetical protein
MALGAQSAIDSLVGRKAENKLSQMNDILPALQGRMVCLTAYSANKKRVWLIGGTSALLWAGSFVALNKAWYTDYERTSFHFFNDNKEWQQVDKIGHVWTSYQISRVTTEAWRWTGIRDRKSVLLGAISGIAYQTIIEIQDGYSDQWGFSWGDMGANFVGSGMYALQELKWKEQRLSIRFSYSPYRYSSELSERRNQMFGKTFMERILKDYNAQTYWLSGNLHSFSPGSRWPAWLNIAVGYNADGMLGGKENVWKDKLGNRVERRDIPRIRHFYLSPDIDFTRIRTSRKFVKKFFFLLNAVKFPAPAIELNSKGKLKMHALTF